MTDDDDEPHPVAPLPVAASVRHGGSEPGRSDGWSGERIATFLEVLADTGMVVDAARAAGMSRQAAYALRNRDPVIAAAWRAAQAKARAQLADGLLERSITGTVEHFYRDGVLVGERRHYESWLGLALLRRLDKQAEEDRRAHRARGTGEHDGAGNALAARMAAEWQAMLDALRFGGAEAVPALFEPEVDKVDIPRTPPGCGARENIWLDSDGRWRTAFPPPPGFAGDENVKWDGFTAYKRECTPEEAALLDAEDAAVAAQVAAEITAEAEAERDAFFESLRSTLRALGRELT